MIFFLFWSFPISVAVRSLTVQIGISDLELVFDSHFSLPLMSESLLLFPNSMDSIPADKVL